MLLESSRRLIERAVGEDVGDGGRSVAAEGDRDVAAAVLGLEVGDRAVEHLVAVRDDADRVAEALGVFHQVRAEDDRAPLAPEVDDRVLERLGVHRVEAAERLVEDDEIGLVEEGADELNLLLHAARELLDARVAPVLVAAGEREAGEPLVDALLGVARAHAFELGEEFQHASHLHLLVESALLGEIADAIARAPANARLSEDRDRASVGLDDVEDHADRRRLAGAVGAEQAVDGSAGNLEREILDCDVSRERLANLIDDERWLGQGGKLRGGEKMRCTYDGEFARFLRGLRER